MTQSITGSPQRIIKPVLIQGLIKPPTVKYAKGLEGEPVEVITIQIQTLDIPEGERYRLAAVGLDEIRCDISITPQTQQLGLMELDTNTGEILN